MSSPGNAGEAITAIRHGMANDDTLKAPLNPHRGPSRSRNKRRKRHNAGGRSQQALSARTWQEMVDHLKQIMPWVWRILGLLYIISGFGPLLLRS
ncbi:hypothetical protein LTR27_003381 [Elasticomyces elasticus]|nr:hypothetical protein LTR27_003381 [Elasticomyces elasticus]